jgi:hypothetical protein
LPGYVANPIYLREMKRLGVLGEDFDPTGRSLDFWFQTDERYYRLFRPEAAEADASRSGL